MTALPPGRGALADTAASAGAPSSSLDVLVLGAGNILLSDEAIGVRVVEALQQRHRLPEGVEVLDGGTCGMDLLDVIADRDHLILVDAVDTGSPPGTIVRLKDDEIPAVFRTKCSPHQLGLQDVLALLRLLDSAPAHVTVIGVQPASLELGLELTPPIAARLDAMVEMVADELTALGVPMTHVSSPREQQRPDDPPLGSIRTAGSGFDQSAPLKLGRPPVPRTTDDYLRERAERQALAQGREDKA